MTKSTRIISKMRLGSLVFQLELLASYHVEYVRVYCSLGILWHGSTYT